MSNTRDCKLNIYETDQINHVYGAVYFHKDHTEQPCDYCYINLTGDNHWCFVW